MDYRREIDGLRALAVVPVILFHAGVGSFSGGFVGVDMFFVISGYLITTILLAELTLGKFSIVNFYERRARRILPALFLTTLVGLPLAWFTLLPFEIRDYAQSLVAVSVFASNILFWQKSGYFDSAAEFKPLLHTWSLAVEEQYYVLFPLLLMVLWPLGRRAIVAVLAVAFVASLAAAQWAAHAAPTAAFYLLPTRGWELLLGAFAALYLGHADPARFDRRLCEVAGWSGLGLIAYAIFAFDKTTPFPGLYALLPTVGTVLIIVYARADNAVGQWIGNRYCVGIGLISYSAYLWHQPLFAFARHATVAAPGGPLLLLLAALALVLAYLSWRYVEAPWRQRARIKRPLVFGTAVLGSLCLFAVGMLGHVYSDAITAYKLGKNPELARSYRLLEQAQASSPVFVDANRFDDGHCRFSVLDLDDAVSARLARCSAQHGGGVLVFGDSHATNLYHALVRNPANASNAFVVGVSKNNCHLPSKRPDCPYGRLQAFLQAHPAAFRAIVFEKAGYLMLHVEGEREALHSARHSVKASIDGAVLDGVAAYLDALSRYAPVTWFGPRLEPMVDQQEFFRGGCHASYRPSAQQQAVFAALDQRLQNYAVGKPWRYVSQMAMVHFDFPADFGDCTRLLWLDANHFSEAGETVFGSRFTLAQLIR